MGRILWPSHTFMTLEGSIGENPIQLPAANPATVPVQKRSRKETECGNNAIPTTGLNCDGS